MKRMNMTVKDLMVISTRRSLNLWRMRRKILKRNPRSSQSQKKARVANHQAPKFLERDSRRAAKMMLRKRRRPQRITKAYSWKIRPSRTAISMRVKMVREKSVDPVIKANTTSLRNWQGDTIRKMHIKGLPKKPLMASLMMRLKRMKETSKTSIWTRKVKMPFNQEKMTLAFGRLESREGLNAKYA
jgi:hypothetical protein